MVRLWQRAVEVSADAEFGIRVRNQATPGRFVLGHAWLAGVSLRDGNYTQAEVAFMVGFSDQSNFARAFRRWTGMTPGVFRKAA